MYFCSKTCLLTACILFSINQTLGTCIYVLLLSLLQTVPILNITAYNNFLPKIKRKYFGINNLVLLKMNKTDLAEATQGCMAHRTFLNAYSIKGLDYFKRPNDSQVSTSNEMGLWNLFMLKWSTASEEPQKSQGTQRKTTASTRSISFWGESQNYNFKLSAVDRTEDFLKYI